MPKVAEPKASPPAGRPISASEIARNPMDFALWCNSMNCSWMSLCQLPPSMKVDVQEIFDVKDRLPGSLLDETSMLFREAKNINLDLPQYLKWVDNGNSSLFFKDSKKEEEWEMETAKGKDENKISLADLECVMRVWHKIHRRQRYNEEWNEADFAANVYHPLRSRALRKCSYRSQCSIQLPQHPRVRSDNVEVSKEYDRVQRADTIIPDGAAFILGHHLRKLCGREDRPYHRINVRPSTQKSCEGNGKAPFRHQATPAKVVPQKENFEFVGVFFEDKKRDNHGLEFAYRQNRMACAAAQRHLHSFYIESPVFGLLWADDKVKAHVDWCLQDGEDLEIFSALYDPQQLEKKIELPKESELPECFPPKNAHPSFATVSTHSSYSQLEPTSASSFEWDMRKPADILCVFIVLRNLDQWITYGFRDRVVRGVNACAEAKEPYVPWRPGPGILKRKFAKTNIPPNTENVFRGDFSRLDVRLGADLFKDPTAATSHTNPPRHDLLDLAFAEPSNDREAATSHADESFFNLPRTAEIFGGPPIPLTRASPREIKLAKAKKP